jgi:hypothetical protein
MAFFYLLTRFIRQVLVFKFPALLVSKVKKILGLKRFLSVKEDFKCKGGF